jgi:hypothetical protein
MLSFKAWGWGAGRRPHVVLYSASRSRHPPFAPRPRSVALNCSAAGGGDTAPTSPLCWCSWRDSPGGLRRLLLLRCSLKRACVCVRLNGCGAWPAGTTADAQPPFCRYWDAATQSWSSHGVVTLGVEVVAGVSYLVCGTHHLTGFVASTGGRSTRFSVNAVDPLGDVGDVAVGRERGARFLPRQLADVLSVVLLLCVWLLPPDVHLYPSLECSRLARAHTAQLYTRTHTRAHTQVLTNTFHLCVLSFAPVHDCVPCVPVGGGPVQRPTPGGRAHRGQRHVRPAVPDPRCGGQAGPQAA